MKRSDFGCNNSETASARRVSLTLTSATACGAVSASFSLVERTVFELFGTMRTTGSQWAPWTLMLLVVAASRWISAEAMISSLLQLPSLLHRTPPRITCVRMDCPQTLKAGKSTKNAQTRPPARMDSPQLFKGGKTTKNRFALASLANCQSNTDGTLNEREAVWLERRAKGGFGIVNTCSAHVQANGRIFEGAIGCFGNQHIEGLRNLAARLQAHGALFVVQLYHAGMRADDTLIEGAPRSCVDTVYKHRGGERKATGLTEDEIEELIQDFVAAAKRVEAAGGDGVEIHAAHGYMLTQFLCPDLNTRSDRWGGTSLENRARLTREVTRRIRAAVSPSFIVGIRISAQAGYDTAGWNVDADEAIQVAKWAAEDGCAYVSVSMFGHSPTLVAAKHIEAAAAAAEQAQAQAQEEALTPLAGLYRAALPDDVVLIVCGGVASAGDVRALLALGVDVVAVGLTGISTPEFPELCVSDAGFRVQQTPPFSEEFLKSVDLSQPFIDYLRTWNSNRRWKKQQLMIQE